LREKRQNQHENISSKNTQQKNRKNCKNVTKTSKKNDTKNIQEKYIHTYVLEYKKKIANYISQIIQQQQQQNK